MPEWKRKWNEVQRRCWRLKWRRRWALSALPQWKKDNKDKDVSENRGTPKSSILIGFSIINHPFWGTPIFGNAHNKEGDDGDLSRSSDVRDLKF